VLQCVAVCCSVFRVLQYVAVYCSVLQCVAVCCSALQWVAVGCSVLQCVAVCCSDWNDNINQAVMQSVARLAAIGRQPVCCSVLQCVAVCCSVLQCGAVCGAFGFDSSTFLFVNLLLIVLYTCTKVLHKT